MSKSCRPGCHPSSSLVATVALSTLMFIAVITTYLGTYPTEHSPRSSQASNRDTIPVKHQQKISQCSDEIQADLQRRRDHVMDTCAVLRNGDKVDQIFVDENSGLAVCHTPKVGCTFWRRFMTFLKDKGNLWKTPFEVDRYSIHHRPKVRVNYVYDSNYVQDRISNLTRIVFGRDPYSRLWSAYVDKFLLPDFWGGHGLRIYSYRNISSGKDRCPLNITFEDFLHYALYERKNSHWDPLHVVCSPCVLYPKYIGKMETFTRDVTYILNKSSLGHLLHAQNHHDHVEDEMSILIDYHFKIYNISEINKRCLTITGLAERLWRAFQLNGYFSLSDKLPKKNLNKSVPTVDLTEAKHVVTKLFVEHYRNIPKSKAETLAQRQSVFEAQYKKIPLSLRQEISKIYKRDFELFQYEQYPKSVFSEKDEAVIRGMKTTTL